MLSRTIFFKIFTTAEVNKPIIRNANAYLNFANRRMMNKIAIITPLPKLVVYLKKKSKKTELYLLDKI